MYPARPMTRRDNNDKLYGNSRRTNFEPCFTRTGINTIDLRGQFIMVARAHAADRRRRSCGRSVGPISRYESDGWAGGSGGRTAVNVSRRRNIYEPINGHVVVRRPIIKSPVFRSPNKFSFSSIRTRPSFVSRLFVRFRTRKHPRPVSVWPLHGEWTIFRLPSECPIRPLRGVVAGPRVGTERRHFTRVNVTPASFERALYNRYSRHFETNTLTKYRFRRFSGFATFPGNISEP